MQFLNWLRLPAQRRFDIDSRRGIRLGFSIFFDCPELLTDDEREELAHGRQIEAMSSDDIKRAVGFTNTGAAPVGAYTARRA